MDSIEHLIRHVNPLLFGRIVHHGQRVYTRMFFEVLDARLWIAFHEKTAPDQKIVICWTVKNEVALGYVTLVTRPHKQVLAAFALVRSGASQIRYVAKPEIVDDAQRIGRTFYDNGTVLQIQPCAGIDTLCVRRQEQRPRVHKALGDTYGSINRAEFPHSFPHGNQRRGRTAVQKSFYSPYEIQVVEYFLVRVFSGEAVKEFQGADPRFLSIRRRDRFGDLCRHLHPWGLTRYDRHRRQTHEDGYYKCKWCDSFFHRVFSPRVSV